MKRLLLMVLIFWFFISACAGRGEPAEMAPPADPDNLPVLAGTYAVNGVDPLGLEYGGHLTLTPGETADSYHFQWIVVGGIQEGLGVVKGNQIVVEWQTIESSIGYAQGTAIYKITELGQLDGIRYVEGLAGEGLEQAYPNR